MRGLVLAGVLGMSIGGMSIGGMSVAGMAGAVQAQEVGEGAAADRLVLAPVMVSGERFVRGLEETTSSVALRMADDLGAFAIQDFDQAVQGLPNLSPPTSLGPPAIRGIPSAGPGGDGTGGYATNVNTGSLPRAPFIVDGVARISSLANENFLDMWDVEQIEVFRGPQSTVRGRNAIAGAYVVETKDPSFTPEGAARVGIELDDFHGPLWRFSGAVSGPVLEDQIAARIAIDHESGQVPLGLTGPKTSLNPQAELTEEAQLSTEVSRLRAKARIEPAALDKLSVDLLFDGAQGTVAGNRFTVADEPISGEATKDRAYPFGRNGGQRVYDTNGYVMAAEAEYALTPAAVLRSITSYTRDMVETNERQSDYLFFDIDERQATQDLVLELSGVGALDGLFGASFNWRWQDVDVNNILLPFADNTFVASEDASDSQALFTDLTYAVSQKVDLLAGARLNRYHAHRQQTSFPGSPGGPLPSASVDNDLTEIRFLPKLGVRYKIVPGQSVAVTARQGYNPGGASVVLSSGTPYEFDSETVWTFEGTYRGSFLDGRLSAGATAFYNRYTDPQLYLQDGPGGNAALRIVNAGKGISYGAEFEAAFAATRAIDLNAGLGLLATEVTEAPSLDPALDGNDFGQDPPVTLSLGGVWRPLHGLRLSADGTYIASYSSDVTNLDAEEAGDYVLLDLAASYTFRQVTGTFYVKNVTDRAAVTRRLANAAGAGYYSDLLPPRTFGFQLEAAF